MASLPLCKNTQFSLMACFIDDFLELFDREKKSYCCLGLTWLYNLYEESCLYLLQTVFHLDKIGPSDIFVQKRIGHEIQATVVFL